MLKFKVLALLACFVGTAQAEIYSFKGADGSIVFTDSHQKGAKTVTVEKPMTIPAVKVRKPKAKDWAASAPMWPEPTAADLPRTVKTTAAEKIPAYDSASNTGVSWSSETQGVSSSGSSSRSAEQRSGKSAASKSAGAYEEFRLVSPVGDQAQWINGELTVELEVEPMLDAEHVIVVRVDGKEAAISPDLQIVLPSIERGPHSVSASIVDVNTGRDLISTGEMDFQVHKASTARKSRMLHSSIGMVKGK